MAEDAFSVLASTPNMFKTKQLQLELCLLKLYRTYYKTRAHRRVTSSQVEFTMATSNYDLADFLRRLLVVPFILVDGREGLARKDLKFSRLFGPVAGYLQSTHV
jgi:hypothetical protein